MSKNNLAVREKSTHKYRDNILRKLCQNKALAIEVVNAITGSNYENNVEVKVRDLESTLLRRYNDIAISIDNELLVMIEHQSTINLNMPFRLLSYCIDVLHAWYVESEDLYSGKLHKIPTPKFYMLYNGTEPLNKKELRLSSMFKLDPPENSLELVVHIVDVNYCNENDILGKSESLRGYAYLVEKIREYQKTGFSRDKAIAVAIQHCVQNNIIREFLENNYQAVVDMFTWEYDEEAEKRVLRREAKEEGIELGQRRAAQKMLAKGLSVEEVSEFLDIPVENIVEIKL